MALAASLALGASATAQCQNYSVATGSATFIEGATTDVGNHCDDCSSVVALPFPVSFYGTVYNSCNVGSNGWIDFTTPHAAGFYTNVCLPTTTANGAFGPAILAFWDDGYTSGTAQGQGIFTQTVGDAPNRQFVIEWRAGFCCAAAAPINDYQVIFTEGSNDFDIVYSRTMADRGSATVGAQQAPGSQFFVEYTCNTAGVITTDLSLHFTCVAPPPTAGACCTAAGVCTIADSPAACTGAGSYSFGVGSTCGTTTCPTGACCTSGVCSVSISNACTGAGNTFTAGAACTGTYASPVQGAHAIEDISISSGTPGTPFTLTGGTLDDGYNTNIPLGFTFNFFGTAQTTINIATNGVIYFGGTAYSGYPAPAAIPAVTTPTNSIGVYWADMLLPSADTITYTTSGVAPYRRFIVQWNNAPRYNLGNPTGSITAQAILYETADAVELRYGNIDPGTPSGPNLIIGVEDATGTVATSFDPSGLGGGNISLFFAAGSNPCSGGAPTGSCCLNGCQQLTYADCLAGGGAFNGNGTTCATAPCSSGACCALAGGCTAQVGPICTGSGGVFQGIGTVCGAVPCPPGGRCCTGTACTVGFQANCSGVFTANAACTPNNCAGSCCDAGGICSLQVSAASCSGTFGGLGTTCTPNPCPGQSCAAPIPLTVDVSVAGDLAASSSNSTITCSSGVKGLWYTFTAPVDGSYNFNSTNTGGAGNPSLGLFNSDCATQIACVNPCTGTVANSLQTMTAGQQIIFRAGGCGDVTLTYSVTVSTAVVGACCNPTSGACTLSSTGATGCGANTYMGDNTACDAVICGQGACCNPANGACSLATQGSCTGQFQSVGTTCTPNPCPQPPTGACCNSTTGACTQVFAINCSATTSTYSGDNTTCDGSGFCPGIGTCCSSLGNCVVRYTSDCPGGLTSNTATSCTPGLCPATTPATCENFDAGSAGSLPNNWSSTSTGAGAAWVIDSVQSYSPSNAVFTNDVGTVSSQFLELPAVTAAGGLTLDFFSYFTTENTFDGWVVEYSTDSGGTWTDVAVGGSWVLNGYNVAAISTNFQSPIAGRPAFSGAGAAWTEHIATIPANSGDSVIIRFQMASDTSVTSTGVWLDDICIGGIQAAAGNGVCCRGSTCSTAFASAAACAAAVDSTAPVTVLSKYVASGACNTPVTVPGTLGNITSPCCYANFNHNASVEVQDIFDFLNDWLAGKKAALVGGDGTTGTLSVQNIFDFLNSWFAGGCN